MLTRVALVPLLLLPTELEHQMLKFEVEDLLASRLIEKPHNRDASVGWLLFSLCGAHAIKRALDDNIAFTPKWKQFCQVLSSNTVWRLKSMPKRSSTAPHCSAKVRWQFSLRLWSKLTRMDGVTFTWPVLLCLHQLSVRWALIRLILRRFHLGSGCHVWMERVCAIRYQSCLVAADSRMQGLTWGRSSRT